MFDHLFSPQKIGTITIKNRLMVPAMVTNLCTEGGKSTDAFVAYHAAKAAGGWGLILTEDYAVEPAGRGYRCVPGLWSDELMESHRAIAEAVHRYEDAKIFAQIYHCGRQTRPELNGGYQPVSASEIPCPFCGVMPRALTTREVDSMVQKFADAARRAKEAGFNGIELHGGHGYLLAQFLSPYSNKRVDQYGGSLENRMRFPLEVIRAVREQVGRDFPIGFRLSADELLPGGRTLEDTLVMAGILQDSGVDMLNVSVGAYGTPVVVAPMQYPHGWTVQLAEKVKAAVDIPVITVNRIVDPFMADQIIGMGRADVVAMGRASLADPDLPNKARAGRTGDIRSCIGCLVCDNSLVRDTHIRCSVNPTLAYEHEGGLQQTDKPKKIYIAGAGPAGLESARVAALRGHEVHLFERESLPGGAFRAAAYPPHKGELATVVAWLWRQCRDLVEMHLDTELTAEMVRADKPDRVIVATGAKPLIPPIPGIGKGHVVTACDALLGKASLGQRVVVAGGGSVGVETACHLAMQHKQVTIVEQLEGFALEEDGRIREQQDKLMQELGVELFARTRVLEITENGVLLERGGETVFKVADHVVLALGYRGDDAFYQAVKELCPDTVMVGDAVKSRKLVDALREGYLAGASD